MTVENVRGHITMSCDGCPGSYLEDDAGDFQAVVAEARDQGWTIQKRGSDWFHFCPGCVEEGKHHGGD